MKQPTIDQILACDDEQQLNEWCAVICMGYEPHPRLHNQLVQRNCDGMILAYVDYTPCQNKAQAFDLMDKYGAWPRKFMDKYKILITYSIELEEDNLLIAIVKASLCSAVSE